jgi:hypothetical protein
MSEEIKRRAAKLSFTQSTAKPGPYRTSGISSDNRENAAIGTKCDERHNGFATGKGMTGKKACSMTNYYLVVVSFIK